MGILYIVATPIGNMEDITIRAIKTLFSVDYIACEDTRRTGQLLEYILRVRPLEILEKGQTFRTLRSDPNLKPKLISYYDEIEYKKVPEIIKLLSEDNNVALVSDGGTPLISDPGYKLVTECIKRNIKVVSIPGPSSVISALTVSGLPPNDFRFIGYLPPKRIQRQKYLRDIQIPQRPLRYKSTLIAFESPHRIKESLKDIKEVFGDIEIVIVREMTKIYEEIWRGKISNILNHNFKGELIILFTPV